MIMSTINFNKHTLLFMFRGLEEVNDFGRFRNLQVLWLNGNKVGTRSGDVHLRSQNSLAWLV